MLSTICQQYIKAIKSFDNYEKNISNMILKKNKNEFTFQCMMDLSKYYDFLDALYNKNLDNKFNLKLKQKYGYTLKDG